MAKPKAIEDKEAEKKKLISEDAVEMSKCAKYLAVAVVFLALLTETSVAATLATVGPYYLAYLEHVRMGNSTQFDLARITTEAGLLLGIGHLCAMVTGIIFGVVVDKIGHKIPLIGGAVSATIAIFGFTLSTHYWQLLVCRVVNSIGNGISSTSGMALVADLFPDDKQRTAKETIGVVGYTLGLVLGFGLSSLLYSAAGPRLPFYVLCFMSLLDAVLRLFVVEPKNKEGEKKVKNVTFATYFDVLRDPYVHFPLACHFVNIFIFRATISTKVAYSQSIFEAESWQVGVVLLIPTVIQLSGQFAVGKFSSELGKAWFVLGGLILNGIGVIGWTMVPTIWLVLIPETFLRVGWSAAMTVTMPLMAEVIDTRHGSQHGTIYGMYFAAYHGASFSGSFFGGAALNIMSFKQLYLLLGIFAILFSVVSLRFRTIPPRHAVKAIGSIDKPSCCD